MSLAQSRFGRRARSTLFRRWFPCALAFIALVPVVHAAESPLTLAEAQRRALARSQLLPAQDAAAAAARRWRSPRGNGWTRC